MSIDLCLPFLAGGTLAIMPRGDDALSLEKREVYFESLSHCLVFMGIAAEQAESSCRGYRGIVHLFVGEVAREVWLQGVQRISFSP